MRTMLKVVAVFVFGGVLLLPSQSARACHGRKACSICAAKKACYSGSYGYAGYGSCYGYSPNYGYYPSYGCAYPPGYGSGYVGGTQKRLGDRDRPSASTSTGNDRIDELASRIEANERDTEQKLRNLEGKLNGIEDAIRGLTAEMKRNPAPVWYATPSTTAYPAGPSTVVPAGPAAGPMSPGQVVVPPEALPPQPSQPVAPAPAPSRSVPAVRN